MVVLEVELLEDELLEDELLEDELLEPVVVIVAVGLSVLKLPESS